MGKPIAASARRRVIFAGLAMCAAMARPASAVPAFSQQTGEPCSACHIGFPQLTPYGRLFKLEGYVAGGGVPGYKNFAGMVQAGFTYLHTKVAGGLAPDYPSNNAWSAQTISLFYGGALYAPIGLGAFVQGTFDGVTHQFHWDNTDIRLARPETFLGKPLYYGFTFNNAPSVTDLWNSTPAWGYPFITDELGVGSAATVQVTALAQQVFGAGVYTSLNFRQNDLLYTEADFYRSLPDHTAYALGVGPEVPISGFIPYWRLALQHSFGNNSFEVGTLGLIDHPYPAGFKHGATDQLLDIGADTQMQLIGAKQAFTLQASYIHESQHWAASYPLGLTANLNDTLNDVTITASYLLHETYGVTESFNKIFGNADNMMYAASPIGGSANGKPNTQSFTTELDYYPWNNGGPAFFPWMNAKLFVEDTIYTQFNGLSRNYDGYGRSASGNNVLFAGIWFLF